MTPLRVQCLGQAGLRFDLDGLVVYCDPYLSDSVEKLDGPAHRRMVPAPMAPGDVTDAAWVLVSHEHLDHFDPDTLGPLAKASPKSRFVVPACVAAPLARLGVEPGRIVTAGRSWIGLGPRTRAMPVPACHPTVEPDGDGYRAHGYVLEHAGRRAYVAGDTSPHPDIVQAVRAAGGADVGFIPVNERNVYKERQGIVGNMSAREAFAFAQELGVKTLVPIHWDMFRTNCVEPEEVQVLHERTKPPFRLAFRPEAV